MLIRFFKTNPVYWFILCIFLAISSMYALLVPAKDSFIQLNPVHTLYLDTFFLNYTILGDGVFSIALFLILLLMERTTLAVQVLISYLFSGLLVQVIKHAIRAPRPHAVFDNDAYPYFLDGITYSGLNSFPSGHTASVFALATLLALHDKNATRSASYLFLAIITGYSRIYLGQHFMADVAAGAFIGVLCAMVIYSRLQEVKIEWSSAGQLVRIQMQ